MKNISRFVLSFLSCIAASTFSLAASQSVKVALQNAEGEKVGEATLTEVKGGVKVDVQATKLAPGKHGIHFHANGVCEGPDFKSAGDHFNPKQKKHGLKNKPHGPHAGDLPNLEVAKDGSAHASMMSKAVSLGKGENSLLKQGGTALMIHAGPDDQKTDPSGKSGDRIACGVILAQ